MEYAILGLAVLFVILVVMMLGAVLVFRLLRRPRAAAPPPIAAPAPPVFVDSPAPAHQVAPPIAAPAPQVVDPISALTTGSDPYLREQICRDVARHRADEWWAGMAAAAAKLGGKPAPAPVTPPAAAAPSVPNP